MVEQPPIKNNSYRNFNWNKKIQIYNKYYYKRILNIKILELL